MSPKIAILMKCLGLEARADDDAACLLIIDYYWRNFRRANADLYGPYEDSDDADCTLQARLHYEDAKHDAALA